MNGLKELLEWDGSFLFRRRWRALARLYFGHGSTHPARTLGLKARKRERVRCSSLVDWPVYPRLRGTMRMSTLTRKCSTVSWPCAAPARATATSFCGFLPNMATKLEEPITLVLDRHYLAVIGKIATLWASFELALKSLAGGLWGQTEFPVWPSPARRLGRQ